MGQGGSGALTPCPRCCLGLVHWGGGCPQPCSDPTVLMPLASAPDCPAPGPQSRFCAFPVPRAVLTQLDPWV